MNKQLQTLLLVGGGIALLAWFARNRISEFNEGTPFEGFGVVGAAGNVANEASGGLFANIGGAIARFLDPNENKTLDELTGT